MKKFLLIVFQICYIILFVNIIFAANFEKSGEYYRYFEDDGSVAYNQIVEWNKNKYYVNNDGYATFNSWVNIDDKYYYAGNDGILFSDGIKEIEGYKYYFNLECELQKGWCNDYICYGDLEDGFLVTGFQELEIPNDWSTEVTNEKTGWFYFDSNTCKKYYAENNEYVCKLIGNDSKYCFDTNGIIRTGWRKVKDTVPTMKGYMYFQEESNDEFKYGEAIKDTWYSVEPPSEVLPNYDVRYFYFNGQGQPRTAPQGKLSKVRFNNKTFLFNEYGFAVYGINLIDNDYYYFGPGVEDCSMKTGHISKDIDGSNDGASFYFADDGKGYTGVYNNKLYYKGKLQKAETEQKYAAFNIGGVTRLVNSTGTLMKNKHKIKDGDGCAWSTNSSGAVVYRDVEASDTELQPPELSGEN